METSQARKDAIFRKKLVDTFCNYGIYIIFLIMIIYFSVQSTGFLSLSNAIHSTSAFLYTGNLCSRYVLCIDHRRY